MTLQEGGERVGVMATVVTAAEMTGAGGQGGDGGRRERRRLLREGWAARCKREERESSCEVFYC